MTVPVIKNIKYGYVQVKNGVASIDTSMTDKAFDTNKPQGVYRCFTFQYDGFGGYDYEDVQHLVSVEESSIWDKVNRTTLLGFNLVTNEFIVNYNAWLSLKDDDLKTDGELPHPSQAGWHIMILSTTKDTNSKFELTQVNGSKAYLSLKPSIITNNSSGNYKIIQPSISCVESKLKSVINSPLVVKNDALWTKSIEDNSVILVNEFVKNITSGTASYPFNSQLRNNNKEYGYIYGDNNDAFASTYRYGKKVLSFDTLTSKNPITTCTDIYLLPNKTTSKNIEFTYTNNLNDILSSGESLTFYLSPKARSYKFIYNKTFDNNYKYKFDYAPDRILYHYEENKYDGVQVFSTYKDKTDEGIACDLVSLDSRKPFVYAPDGRDFKINGIAKYEMQATSVNYLDFIKNLPDGFIAVGAYRTGYGGEDKTFSLRVKNGESIKKKMLSVNYYVGMTVSGSTQFGNEAYATYPPNAVQHFGSIDKNDLINGIGFEEYDLDKLFYTTRINAPVLITILKV